MADLLLALATDPTAPVATLKDDIDLRTGDLQLTSGSNAIRQDILTRLRTGRGEVHIDQRIGIPYFEEFLVSNPDEAAIEAILKTAILTTPGVIALDSYSQTINSTSRSLSVSFQAQITGDEVLSFEEALIV